MSEPLHDHMPPQNQQAERAVLGSMLRDNRCIDEVAISLKTEDFYADAHQRLYPLMLSLHEKGAAVDLVVLTDLLKQKGMIEDVGGYGVLGDLLDAAPSAANVAHYARIVKDRSRVRNLIHAATDILSSAYNQTMPADDLLEEAERKILALADVGSAGLAKLIGQAVDSFLDGVGQVQADGVLPGVSTGISDLDTLTGGLQGGSLMIVAARPSIGKTALATAIARDAAMANHNVFFSSLEQSAEEIAGRLVASTSGIDGQSLRHAALCQHDFERLAGARQILFPLPLWVDDGSRQSMLRISSNARRIHRRHGLSLVVVDYLQLVTPEDRRSPRQEQVAGISRRLKELAKELSVPVIALAQLNRESESRQGGRPKLSDLRESDSIAADADLVLLLHKPASNPDVLEMILAKNRNGPVGEFEVEFDRKRMAFRDRISTPFA